MPRQTESQQPKGRPNPATTSPDDDEAQAGDVTQASEQDPRRTRDRRGDDGTEEPAIQKEEMEDDAETEEGSGAHV